mmetsp:Transcript_16884/g.35273  ORF Transcript_16884/g.35273 Transcript_16884/m.35273 type:complete len:1008 (+) Transcript_16884:850-3873(+)
MRAWQTIRRCITDSPSRMPSSSPTASVLPTRYPTEYPSKSPTSSPIIPTILPTDAPTGSPTQSPTNLPSEYPVEPPSFTPTSSPTSSPTQSPTNAPTESPVDFSTEPPTDSPTHFSTDTPMNSPTNRPTGSPTHQPTEAPTGSPISSPTGSPTTELPTASSRPSIVPTSSQKPSFSLFPSASPSTSQTPTVSPSAPDDKVSYTYVGSGTCHDERGEWYDWLRVPDIQTVDDCAKICSNSVGINSKFQFVGFEYGDGCVCLYTNGGLPYPIPSENIGFDSNGNGVNMVASAVAATEVYDCYSYDLFTESVDGFSFAGVGLCEDENGEWYDYFSNVDDMATIQDCANYCTSIQQDFSKLVGFEFSLDYNECYCLYTGGRLPTSIPSGASHSEGNSGFGEITGSSGYGSYVCNANDSFNLSDTFDSFTYVGDGFCRSGDNFTYNYFSRNDTSSDILCAEWCFVSQGYRGVFAGFQHHASNKCDCLYSIANGIPPSVPLDVSQFDFSNSGDGEIEGVFKSSNTICYKNTFVSQFQFCSPIENVPSSIYLAKIAISENEVGFGNSVGISRDGKYAIIGAQDDGKTYYSEDVYGYGSAFIFEILEDGSCISPIVILPPIGVVFNELDSFYHLGQSVAIDGDTALVFMQAKLKDVGTTGTILVYRLYGDNDWRYDRMISGIDANATNPNYFGRQLDLSGEVAIIGGYREVFMYSFADGVANPFSRLIPSDGYIYSDYHYKFISISGDVAIYGSDSEEVAYIFRKQSNGEWLEEAKLEPSTEMLNYGNWFGTSVSIHGDVAIVGAYYYDVYIYRRYSSGEWLLEAQLPCPDYYEYFGSSVGINGKYAIVGDFEYDYGEVGYSGIAYIYREAGGVWSLESNITGTQYESYLGYSIAMSESAFLIGGYDDDFDETVFGRFYPDALSPSSSPTSSVVPTTSSVPSIAPTFTLAPSITPSSAPSFAPTSSSAPSVWQKGMSKRRRETKEATTQKEPMVRRSHIGGTSKGSEPRRIHQKN